jgi:hypothetical protein
MNFAMKHPFASFVLPAVCLAASASAQPVAIDDPGFEATPLQPCAFRDGFLNSAWTSVPSGAGSWKPGSCWDISPFEGSTIAYSNSGRIRQELTTAAIPGATYTLSVAVGRRTNPCCPYRDTTLLLEAGTGDARVTVAQRIITLAEAPVGGRWGVYRVTGTVPSGTPTGLPLVITLSSAGAQVNFDAVVLERGSGCAADFNGDDFLDFFDYADYVTCFETGECPAGLTADFNGDDFVDFFDFDAFVAAFEAGC